MRYAVIVRYKGNLMVQGVYRTRDAAEKRVDRVTGGEIHIFGTLSVDENQILQEFKDSEVRAL